MKFTTVDQYIQSFPEEQQQILEQLRQVINEELPDASEIISYNLPAFAVAGETVIFLAGWKKYISLYPYTDDMAKDFPESAAYRTSGKGTIQFSYDQELPIQLIRKIIQYRLREVRGKHD